MPEQPKLFDQPRAADAERQIEIERIVLYALGDFQARGKVLIERELPLDRLRGALKRAAEAHKVEELRDEQAVRSLLSLGASVRQVPSFVAKHPFRVLVPKELAARARDAYMIWSEQNTEAR
jgi:hypothetical protein